MRSVSKIIFNECEETKCVEVKVRLENQGKLLNVPVYLKDVCPCRKAIVGVEVYVRGKFYARQIKKVWIGASNACRRIHKFYVGEFVFLFADICEETICIKVSGHYIE